MSIVNKITYYTTDELIDILKKDNIQIDNKLVERARTNDDKAFCSIGEKYYNSRDHLKAMIWFLKAAYFNNSSSQYYIGRIFETGTDSFENKRQALEWYQRSSDQSNRLAITRIIKLRWKGYCLDSNQKAFINLERKSDELKRGYYNKIEDLEQRYQANLKVLDYEQLSSELVERKMEILKPIQEMDEIVLDEAELLYKRMKNRLEAFEQKNQLLEDSIKILERENLLNQEVFEKEKKKTEDCLNTMKVENKKLHQKLEEEKAKLINTLATFQEKNQINLAEICNRNKDMEDKLLEIQSLATGKQSFDERLVSLEKVFSRLASNGFTVQCDNIPQSSTAEDQYNNQDSNKIRIVVEYKEKSQ